ncbi:hypothetical protein FSW04_10830 [Baekduia soli]|uniref:GNAT family N-acetyltransferase n=1 Tax=Baekduia soli TaxID=496014 RepID=A0A5B8U555_9ACTN|nr:hypothetical protein [Baekduia soli]QEC48015.1 hypothetical protein FSW04_10830 [Baekduia soli]
MSFVLMGWEHHHHRHARPPPPPPRTDAVVLRPAYPDDAAALTRLAALDSRRPLAGPVVVAERDGVVLAARAADDGRVIADPFAPTADLVALLRAHALQAPRPHRRRELLRLTGTNPWRRPALSRG